MSRRMSPAEFLVEFSRLGGVLRLDGDQIRYRAPRGVVTEKTITYMKRHKTELVALLTEEATTDPDGLLLRSAILLFDGEIDHRRVCVHCGVLLPDNVPGLYCTRHGGKERYGDLLPALSPDIAQGA